MSNCIMKHNPDDPPGLYRKYAKRRKRWEWVIRLRYDNKNVSHNGFEDRAEAIKVLESIRGVAKAPLPVVPVGIKDNQLLIADGYQFKAKPGNICAMSEMLVAADLMRRGYDVFRALGATSSCDLVALHKGMACRVEVKTAPKDKQSKFLALVRKGQADKHDVLAVVSMTTFAIRYSPDVSEWFSDRAYFWRGLLEIEAM